MSFSDDFQRVQPIVSLDARTPVLVGTGQFVQRVVDPREGLEPLKMMAEALERAADDAGSRELLRAADSVRVCHGLWDYSNPAAWLAERFGADGAQTALGMISGTTVNKLIGGAALEIQRGRRDVALIVGGEAEHSRRSAKRAGVELPVTELPDSRPDLTVGWTGPMPSHPERELGVRIPTQWFALIDNALRAKHGRSPAEHRLHIAELWARFSAVAGGNPNAWIRKPMSAADIAEATPDNRMTTYPYTKFMCSNMVVDQAAAVIVCSLEAARRFGVSEDRFVFPLAATDCGGVPGLSHRPAFDREPAMEIAGRRALELQGIAAADLDYVDLYSCFPAAVQLSAQALGLDIERELTVTGGNTFAGGPFNNYVLHATGAMMDRLRAEPGSVGLVTGVGGCLSTHAFSLYSTEPPARGFQHEELSDAVAAVPQAEFVAEHEGVATIESYAPTYKEGIPDSAAIALKTDAGERTWALSQDPGFFDAIQHEELIGRRARISERKLVEVL